MKNMKLKTLAAACMMIGTSSAFAAVPPQVCNITSAPVDAAAALEFANTCTPDLKLYVAGASAMGAAITTVVPADLFEGTITKVIDAGSPMGTTGANAVSAWYGFGKAGTTFAGKKVFAVYNKQNGSAAGISQLLSTIKDTTIPEQDVVTIGPMGKTAGVVAATQATSTGGANTCTTLADTVVGGITYHNVSCTTHARTQADLGMSDVHPIELFAFEGVKPKAVTTLTSVEIMQQGFGLAVNQKFYDALQTQNIAEGLLPATCVVPDATAACQPSVRRADYASLISVQGSIKSAAGFIPGDVTKLILARRDDLSGSQAASNIFFADNACGNSLLKGKVIKGVRGGMLDLITDTTVVDPAKLVVHMNATGQLVAADMGSATDYSIGVISLNTSPTPGKWVKIDGKSPNYMPDGSVAYKTRESFLNGDYPFVVTSYAATVTKPTKGSIMDPVLGNPDVAQAVITGMSDSTLHDLTGIGYTDAADDSANIAAGTPKQSNVKRTNGNNCSPLIK